jgi:hypothetical protein
LQTKKKIILCESGNQAKWLSNNADLKNSVTDIISVNLDAIWEFERNNIINHSFDEFNDDKSSQEIEHLQMEQVKWSEKVDEVLQEKIPDFKLLNFSPARAYLYYLKNSWDTLIYYADTLEQIQNRLEPEEIFYFNNPHTLEYNSDLSISGSLLAECIPDFADYYNIKYSCISGLPGESYYSKRNNLQTTIVKRILSFLQESRIRDIKSIISNSFIINFPDFFHSPVNLKILTRMQYDINENISDRLSKKGIVSLSFNDAVIKTEKFRRTLNPIDQFLQESWYDAIKSDWFFQQGGWPKWSIRHGLEHLFHDFWFGIVPELWKNMNQSQMFLKKEKPLGICVPSIWGIPETGFIMAAHNENIPVIFYQHGASMGDIENSIWDLIDCYYSNYMLVYGEGSVGYIQKRQTYSGLASAPIPIGSTRLEHVGMGIRDDEICSIRNRIQDGKDLPLIVYVPGIYPENIFRYDYSVFRFGNIFKLRHRLAELFRDYPDIHFIYKPFTQKKDDYTINMLSKICPRCVIINNIPLSKLQWAADLIIHEVPSTGMFEGIMTNKQLIVFVDSESYLMPDRVKDLLKKRAAVPQTADELIETIRLFIERGDFSPLINPNREFIKNFCTHMDDGMSVSRAADAILEIAKKTSHKT